MFSFWCQVLSEYEFLLYTSISNSYLNTLWRIQSVIDPKKLNEKWDNEI